MSSTFVARPQTSGAGIGTALLATDRALADLGGEITSENASAVSGAIQDVATAARGVADTLADC